MRGQQTGDPLYSSSPPPYQPTVNPFVPHVDSSCGRDDLLPPFRSDNGTTITFSNTISQLAQQPSSKTIAILAFVLGLFVGAFFQQARSTNIEQRERAGIHWLSLERSKHCERYGTRKYQAKLGPIVNGYDPMTACRKTEVDIHGRKMKPTFCEDKGVDHGIWGNWVVDFDEGGCRPFWEGFNDKGCVARGSGLRRFDAHLINLDFADGWNNMCSSTPADFNGLHFSGAMSCAKRPFGVFGTWDIEDSKCR